jgi:NAD-dependent dihydropyrimidine dehydrogenase PreA subunit
MGTATCEQLIFRQGAKRPCGQVVGIRSWYDSAGTLHRACPNHVAGRLHRYPESNPPEPEWLHEDPAYHTDTGHLVSVHPSDCLRCQRDRMPEYADPITAGKGYHDWQAGR